MALSTENDIISEFWSLWGVRFGADSADERGPFARTA
jgi:hypothetical protein